MSGCNPDVEHTAQPGVRRLWPSLRLRHLVRQISVDRQVPNMASGEATSGSSVAQALVGGTPQRVGWYRSYYADERWEWSPEVELIHGYRPRSSNPTTELVLSHKHPEDFEHVATTLEDIRRTHKAFSTRHRIIAVQGHHNTGDVSGTQGFYIDVTPTDEAREGSITEAVANISEKRAVIEPVKGIWSLVYRIDPGAAFDLLKWRSQEANVKLRALAEQLFVDFRAMEFYEDVPPRATFDRLLLTAHHRVRVSRAQPENNGPPRLTACWADVSAGHRRGTGLQQVQLRAA